VKLQSPTRKELINLRQCHRLTQIEAAALALSSLRAWQYWERGDHVMHPAIWRYVQIVVRALVRRTNEAKPQSPSTIGDT
jgi:hypothetical protein